MSSDLILSIKNDLALIEPGLDEDTLAVAGSGLSTKRISIKGGVFRKIVGGKEVGKIDARHMQIVFVKLAHTPSRTYYKGSYVEGANVAPDCWSQDAKVPESAVKQPMAASCDKCPMSVKGTGQNGKGTACRIGWRTAVVLPSDPSGDVMQLVLPAASVFGDEENNRWPFRAYVQMLASHNISAGRVVTKMEFDTDSPSPRVLFSPMAAVPPNDVATIIEQGKSSAAENAVKMTVFQSDHTAESDDDNEVPQPTQTMASQKAEPAPTFQSVQKEEDAAPTFTPSRSVQGQAVAPTFTPSQPVPQTQTFAAPASPAATEVPATFSEPTLRSSGKTEGQGAPDKDVAEVIKKWASKKG